MNHATVRLAKARTGYCIYLYQPDGKGKHVLIANIKTTNRSPVTVGKVIMHWCNDGYMPSVNKKEGIEEVILYKEGVIK